MGDEVPSDVFYHVDKQGELQVGDTMELEWPPHVSNVQQVKSPDKNEEILKEEYADGLSRHGARYAQSTIIQHSDSKNLDEWDILSGAFTSVYTRTGGDQRINIPANQVSYEWIFELIRMSEFQHARSRFQSFFACPSLKDAEEYREEHRTPDADIFKVRCDDSVIRDMDLVEFHHFGTGLDNARRYWKGECGSESPTCEVVMEPPVEVIERVK